MTILTRVAAATPRRPPSRPSRLLIAGLVAGPLFTVGYLAQGWTRDDGYAALRHPVSSLGLGPHGWQQILNFIVCGLLVLAFAAGLRRSLRPGPGSIALPALVAVWGVGLLGGGIFVTDPVGGYPTAATPVTWHGLLHDFAFALPGFTAFMLAMLTAAVALKRRGSGRLAAYSLLSAIAFTVLFVLATRGFSGSEPWTATAGLWQRLCVSVGWLWLFVLAVHRRRATE